MTASESTGITNDVQNDTVDSKDAEPEHADIEKEKGNVHSGNIIHFFDYLAMLHAKNR